MFTQLLLFCCIGQLGTLQVEYDKDTENIESFIHDFSLRLFEVVDK